MNIFKTNPGLGGKQRKAAVTTKGSVAMSGL